VLHLLLDLGHGRFVQARDRLAVLPGIWWNSTDFLFLPDLVEAGVRSGHLDQANEALAAFEVWLNLTGQPWGRAIAHRCHALVSDDAHAASRA